MNSEQLFRRLRTVASVVSNWPAVDDAARISKPEQATVGAAFLLLPTEFDRGGSG